MKTKRFVIRSSYNGSYLMSAEYENYWDKDMRYWTGKFDLAKRFTKEEADDIVQYCDFGRVEFVK